MDDQRALSRRHYLLAAGTTTASVGLAGCLDTIPFLGDEPLEFEATAATVPAETLGETGYETVAVEALLTEETFEAAGQTQDVHVVNQVAEYERTVDFGGLDLPVAGEQEAAVFIALSTPQVAVLGQAFNPVADMSAAELAEMIQANYDDMRDLQLVDETAATVAGQDTTVAEFEGEAELLAAGVTVDLTLHVSEAVEAGDDLVVAVGGYPTPLRDEEEAHVFAMAAAISHEALDG